MRVSLWCLDQVSWFPTIDSWLKFLKHFDVFFTNSSWFFRAGTMNMYVLFGSHSTLAEKNICQSGLCENQYSSQKLQNFLKNAWKSGYHFISDTGPIFQQKVQIKTTSNSENIFFYKLIPQSEKVSRKFGLAY